MTDLPCKCGAVRVRIHADPTSCIHTICYCADCRAYLRWLARDDLLDAHGGTELVLIPVGDLGIARGADRLRCLRLSRRGPFRFFAGCCNTPLGSTMRDGPLASVVARGLGLRPATRPIGIHARSAVGGAPEGAHARVPASLWIRLLYRVVRESVRGRSRPSPFFDDRGSPRAEPVVLSAAERRELRARDLREERDR